MRRRTAAQPSRMTDCPSSLVAVRCPPREVAMQVCLCSGRPTTMRPQHIVLVTVAGPHGEKQHELDGPAIGNGTARSTDEMPTTNGGGIGEEVRRLPCNEAAPPGIADGNGGRAHRDQQPFDELIVKESIEVAAALGASTTTCPCPSQSDTLLGLSVRRRLRGKQAPA